jgi:hypothetical protein
MDKINLYDCAKWIIASLIALVVGAARILFGDMRESIKQLGEAENKNRAEIAEIKVTLAKIATKLGIYCIIA